ncbi:hypothetical protein [Bosea sp. LjRoot90]|uniref:hypothetical protein n=1 Tax=Bosea sp. LjRoot90 TaxID=3342342 RepID=UPI003F4FF2FD
MDFNSLDREMKDLLRPFIPRIIVSMEAVVSGKTHFALKNCSLPDNIDAISNYIQSLKSDGCQFDHIQNMNEGDIFVYTDNRVQFDIDVYFNGKKNNNGFFAVFSARIDAKGDYLIFETIKT